MSYDTFHNQIHCYNIVDKTAYIMERYIKRKFFVNEDSYHKLFINQLLNPVTTLHARYKENLIIIDTKDFLKQFYSISESFRKIHSLSKINSLLIKPFPNFLGMNLFYSIVQQNLQKKQKLLNANLKIVNDIKKEISEQENKYQFLNYYNESFRKVFEKKELLLNNDNNQLNSKIQNSPLKKEKSILSIEHLIECIHKSYKKPLHKDYVLNNQCKQNIDKLQIKSLIQTKRKDYLINRKNTKEEKYISNKNVFHKYLEDRKEKKQINLTKRETFQTTKKHYKLLVSKDSPIKYLTLSHTLVETDNNKSKELSFYNSNKLNSNTEGRLTLEEKNESNRFLKTRAFFERLKIKKNNHQIQMNSFISSMASYKPIVSSSKSRNSKTTLFTHSKTSDIDGSCNKKLSLHTNNAKNINRLLYQTDFKIKIVQSKNTQNNCSHKISYYKNQSKQKYPTKLKLNNVQLTHRTLRSSILKHNKFQHTNNYNIKNNNSSNNSSHNYLTSSIFSDSTELNQCTTIKPRSSNYCLYNKNHLHIKNIAFFLRKDKV